MALWRCGGGLPAQELVEHGLVRGWPLGRYGSWWCGLPALLCAGARRWPVGWVAASREQSGGMGMRGRGATCLPRSTAAERRLQSLALVDPRTARRLCITRAHTSKHIQQIRNSTPNNVNQYKTRVQNYSTRCKDRVSARNIENGVKTR